MEVKCLELRDSGTFIPVMSAELRRRQLLRKIEAAKERLDILPYGPEGETLNDQICAMLQELYALDVASKTGKAA